MSIEIEQDDELDPSHEQLPADVQALLRQGRKAKEEAEAAAAALAATQRELAFERAGIPDSPQKALLLKAYDGPSDVEAIRAAAEEYGLLGAAGTAAVTDAEIAAQRAVHEAATGTPAPGDIDAAVAMRNAKSQAEVMQIVREVAGEQGFKTRDGLIGVLPEV